MSIFGGSYDLWKTREPVERRYEEELVWRVDGYSPHRDKPVDIGEFGTEETAYYAANTWLLRAYFDDPDFACDYWTHTRQVDLLEDCTCWGKLDKWCPIHDIDPDQAYENMKERRVFGR